MTVANFTPKERPQPKVWVCDCGNESFWLYEDGRIECMSCSTFHTTMTGYWKLFDPEAPIKMRADNATENQERQEDSPG
jgi:hypothetical protein